MYSHPFFLSHLIICQYSDSETSEQQTTLLPLDSVRYPKVSDIYCITVFIGLLYYETEKAAVGSFVEIHACVWLVIMCIVRSFDFVHDTACIRACNTPKPIMSNIVIHYNLRYAYDTYVWLVWYTSHDSYDTLKYSKIHR